MEENITVVFRGFLNLKAKEKLRLVEEINNYFDSDDREKIRAENEENFGAIDRELPEILADAAVNKPFPTIF